MLKLVVKFLFLLVLLPAAVCATTTNTAPYIEPFEDYTPGQSLVGTGGWSAGASSWAAVTNLEYYRDFHGVHPVNTNHEHVLNYARAVTNELHSPANEKVWIDMLLHGWETTFSYGNDADGSFMEFYVDQTNGFLSVTFRNVGKGVKNAQLRSVGTNEWVRLSLEQDYVNSDAKDFHFSRIFVNGEMATNQYAAQDSVGTGSGGPWFKMLLSGVDSFERLSYGVLPESADIGGVDDIVVRTNSPLFSLSRSTVRIEAIDPVASELWYEKGTCVVSRAGGDLGVFAVLWYDVSGTATPGVDYAALPGYATFSPGQTSLAIVVTPYNTAGDEPDETVIISLRTNAYCVLGSPDNATVTIYNDEGDSNKRHRNPSSRRTPLTISEIMYFPADRGYPGELEYVEVFNTDPVDHDIGGYRLTGEISYEFPRGLILPARAYVVVAKNPAAMNDAWGVPDALGPYVGSLGNGGGTVRLRNKWGALFLEARYSGSHPWPASAAGAGHSLTLVKPDYGERDIRAWAASSRVGGSPGFTDPYSASGYEGIVINEFMAHTDLPDVDYIELFNYGTATVDLAGCRLSDDAGTNKYQVGPGRVLGPGDYAVFYETNLGFALSAGGEGAYLSSPGGDTVIDALEFGAQRNGVSTGRDPDGSGRFVVMESATPGSTNSGQRVEDVVINEIMYHPISNDGADEYVELYNKGTSTVDISHWRFIDGVDYAFPAGAAIPAGGHVVVGRNATNLVAKYAHLNGTNTYGDFGGGLSDRGEKIVLAKPDDPGLPLQDFVTVDEVTYGDGDDWGKWADGGGSSLELIDPRSDNRLGMNWAGSDETFKTTNLWTTVSYTGTIDNGSGALDDFRIFYLSAGECLVDNVELATVGGATNCASDFESGLGTWQLLGNHCRSVLKTTEGYQSSSSLHVRASGRGSNTDGNTTIRDRVSSSLLSTPSGTVTIKAKARWLCGWPQMVMGVHGYYIEAPVRLELPPDLGSPGLRNSAHATNAGPAISEVAHSPVLPGAGSNVVISARIHDPDGIASVSVRWRNDSDAPTTTNTPSMNDTGINGDLVAGDGVYSVRIAGLASGKLMAFKVEASDAMSTANLYPGDAPAGRRELECLVRFGETASPGDLGVYRMWLTAANLASWDVTNNACNELTDITFVDNNHRVIYNGGARWRGWWRSYGNPTADGAYSIALPKSDRFLGSTELKIDEPYYGDDPSRQTENYCYWLAREVGLPASYCRYVQIYCNGGDRGINYDFQPPSTDLCTSWFNDDDPLVFKNVGYGVGDAFGDYRDGLGRMKKGRYRWALRKRLQRLPNDDYDTAYRLVHAFATVDTGAYIKRVEAVLDIRGWASVFAVSGAVGGWDHPGYSLNHNSAPYLPRNARGSNIGFDWDHVLQYGGSPLYPGGNTPSAERMFAPGGIPRFRRVYMDIFREMVDGPMRNDRSAAMLNAWYDAFVADGYSPGSPASILTSVAGHRSSMLTDLAALTNLAFDVTTTDFSTASNIVTIAGNAPVQVWTIRVNSNEHPVAWITETLWNVRVSLSNGVNPLLFTALGRQGNALGSDSVAVTQTGAGMPAPDGKLVINEIMYHPAEPYASFIELHNMSSSNTFELGGLRLNGVDYRFGYGNFIGPTGFVVVAGNLPGYQGAYSNAEVVVGEFSGTLDNGGETLKLERRLGTNWVVIDELRYDDDAPWPLEADGQGPSLQLLDPAQDNRRAGNWAVATSGRIHTPGEANWVVAAPPELGALWLNEVMASNSAASGILDNAGDYDPWVEIHNAGTGTVDMGAMSYYLTDDPGDLTKWAFPVGWEVNAGGHLVVWTDAEESETSNNFLHAGFRIDSVSGMVALVVKPAATAYVVDYLEYGDVGGERSYGSSPEGDPLSRQVFDVPTPGWENNTSSQVVEVRINEWMARNTDTLADPADNDFDDWFELYNAGPDAVNLSGYFVSDSLSDSNKYELPGGTVLGPGEWMLIWADNETGQNGPGRDLHVNFQLSGGGEQLGLFGVNGRTVDGVVFGAQEQDVSEGRWPNGAEDIYTMPIPTPAWSNRLFVVRKYGLGTNASTRLLEWSTRAGRKYRVLWKEHISDTNEEWQPLGPAMNAPSAVLSTNVSIEGPFTTRYFRVEHILPP